MIEDDVNPGAIQFFNKIAPTLFSRGYVNGVIAGELTFMTPQGARKHLGNLTTRNYLRRVGNRRWEPADRIIKHPDLIPLVRHIYSPVPTPHAQPHDSPVCSSCGQTTAA